MMKDRSKPHFHSESVKLPAGEYPPSQHSFESQRLGIGGSPHGSPMRDQITVPHNPYANMIAVSNNGVSPHLPFREWMLRGVVGGIGKLLAWPFQLVRDIISAIAIGVIGVVKVVLMIVLVPSAILIGLQIAATQSKEASIGDNAQSATSSLGAVGQGAWNGLFGEEAKTEPSPSQEGESAAKPSRSAS